MRLTYHPARRFFTNPDDGAFPRTVGGPAKLPRARIACQLASRLREFQSQPLAQNFRRAQHRAQRYRLIGGVKQAVERGTTGPHRARHIRLGHVLFVHPTCDLPGDHPLEVGCFDLSESAVLGEQVIKRRADMFVLFHRSLAMFGHPGIVS